ncbi:uncharacterized protein MCYG_01635 [Microsporum canis CBS 113480]|uniref:Uncharacterized protein n=1 Tax=Arthroderma otae (strain ATCC MYA-4605 / CBS 113480) TaxID=554155 RepID=C5FH97_ARTOC|nr:uncharacterized protein MCYG_01635 [Microsporum canis CBS 113480]EEQ28816.1 predicted protein [Microsporum canis CBS 113480]
MVRGVRQQAIQEEQAWPGGKEFIATMSDCCRRKKTGRNDMWNWQKIDRSQKAKRECVRERERAGMEPVFMGYVSLAPAFALSLRIYLFSCFLFALLFYLYAPISLLRWADEAGQSSTSNPWSSPQDRGETSCHFSNLTQVSVRLLDLSSDEADRLSWPSSRFRRSFLFLTRQTIVAGHNVGFLKRAVSDLSVLGSGEKKGDEMELIM